MKIALITPAPKNSRAGNRTTALRWARQLRAIGHRVEVATDYVDQPADLMLALHAWHSAGAITRFRARHPSRPVVVALTGTDVYHYLDADPLPTLRSLEIADALVGLHDLVGEALPARLRGKLRVIHQSAVPLSRPGIPSRRAFEMVLIGHLRAVKDPMRAAEASRLLPASSAIRVVHLGGAADVEWADRARAAMATDPRYDWRGEVPAYRVREMLARASVMLLTSLAEGGANAISEAVVAGTPVIASEIIGSVGLLGRDYPGYYPIGDTAALAAMMLRAERDADFLAALRAHCAARAPLFAPAREQAAWADLLSNPAIGVATAA